MLDSYGLTVQLSWQTEWQPSKIFVFQGIYNSCIYMSLDLMADVVEGEIWIDPLYDIRTILDQEDLWN